MRRSRVCAVKRIDSDKYLGKRGQKKRNEKNNSNFEADMAESKPFADETIAPVVAITFLGDLFLNTLGQ